ncbi:putative regulatory protein, FmdB family [Polaromonas sp. YR568]|uniref:FmdB family zinc ribbon protein n=1 Tax=Polaromonas sp. YR568 TaxID=1855301 RepID=UPI0008E76D04|nr:FmdB family zinc ribbon protein [Polaromonas sp. YR568]SFU63508.1 putative regulatory protein, FmdB family [Polaromonas sp. YR568]
MPIYAYKCESCGHAKDVLQKISDAPLTVCPQCGEPAFKKQVTAAGFQLKGSGWYVTDFRGGNSTGVPAPKTDGAESGASKPADSGTAAAAPSPAPASAPAPAAPAKASGSDTSSKTSS